MRTILVILSLTLVSGCSTVQEWIPSFWDDNQSHYIVQARLSAERLDCDQAQIPQVRVLEQDLRRFELYSESKGRPQADVLRVVKPIKLQVDEWLQRGEASKGYCTVKRKLLVQETARAAQVVLGRW